MRNRSPSLRWWWHYLMKAFEGMNMDKPFKHSNAPKPISPVGDYSRHLKPFETHTSGIADWKHWKQVTTVELWQALLLSLNVNPPGNGWLIDNALGRTGDIPYEYLDSQGLTNEFIRRWKVLRNKLDYFAVKAEIQPTTELTNFISLIFFTNLAIAFKWENLPPELISLTNYEGKSGQVTLSQENEFLNLQQELYKPRTAIGVLALEAAEFIESFTNKKASAEEVMALLQQWADEGEKPETLISSDKKNRCVIWQTDKRKNTDYTLEACRRTLKNLDKSRF